MRGEAAYGESSGSQFGTWVPSSVTFQKASLKGISSSPLLLIRYKISMRPAEPRRHLESLCILTVTVSVKMIRFGYSNEG
jgi:hypothetical protein